jgi:superfamily I DNA and/or RNA helicase
VITKLIQNYRSHEDILRIPNELFYNGDLVASAPRDVQDAFIGWSELPNYDFPLIFKGIVGQVTLKFGANDPRNLTQLIF